MNHFVTITELRPSHRPDDNPFRPGTGPLEPCTYVSCLSAWDLLHLRQKDRVVHIEFISEDQYQEGIRALCG